MNEHIINWRALWNSLKKPRFSIIEFFFIILLGNIIAAIWRAVL